MDTENTFVLLPACSFPTACYDDSREADLQANLHSLSNRLPQARLVVCDNGQRAPEVPKGVTLVHDSSSFSDDPSIGECRNLLNGLRDLDDGALVIKLHARCKLKNFSTLKEFLQENKFFFLLSPNIWGHTGQGYDQMPYIDTRVFAARAGDLRRLLSTTLVLLERNGGRFEQALLAVLLQRPADCALVHSRGHFFPILGGSAGHGRDYSAPFALIRSKVKALIFRFGL